MLDWVQQQIKILAGLSLFLGFASFGAEALPPAAHWNLNDVSYLFPLPLVTDAQSLIAATPQFLPPSVYRQLEIPVTSSDLPTNKLYSLLRVVGMRVDPCSRFSDELPCDPELRLVWQIVHPVIVNPTSPQMDDLQVPQDPKYFTAENGGMHTFYRLTPVQMKSLLTDLWNLKLLGEKQTPAVVTTKLPIQVHPAFANKDYAPKFLASLKKIISTYAQASSLIQTTVIQFNPAGDSSWWLLQGVRKEKTGWKLISIPRVDYESEKIFNDGSGFDAKNGIFPIGLKVSIAPPLNKTDATGSSYADDLSTVLIGGSDITAQDKPEFQTALRSIRAFENPTRKDMNQAHLDCAQCHLVEGTEFWMNLKLPGFARGVKLDAAFANPNEALYDLTNHSVAVQSSKILRSFGYWKQYPAFNQRLINESTNVADCLNHTPNFTQFAVSCAH